MALASSSSRNPGVPYSADQLREKLVDDAGNNATDLYCPLGGCRCLLLRKGSARLVKRDGEALLHPSAKPTTSQNDEFPLASTTIEGEEQQQDCWLVTSPLTFENIGFTKGVLSNTLSDASSSSSSTRAIASLPEGASIRYLACADCDCGPLGWHVESKGSDLGRDVDKEINTGNAGAIREFLLAVERCRYKLA